MWLFSSHGIKADFSVGDYAVYERYAATPLELCQPAPDIFLVYMEPAALVGDARHDPPPGTAESILGRVEAVVGGLLAAHWRHDRHCQPGTRSHQVPPASRGPGPRKLAPAATAPEHIAARNLPRRAPRGDPGSRPGRRRVRGLARLRPAHVPDGPQPLRGGLSAPSGPGLRGHRGRGNGPAEEVRGRGLRQHPVGWGSGRGGSGAGRNRNALSRRSLPRVPAVSGRTTTQGIPAGHQQQEQREGGSLLPRRLSGHATASRRLYGAPHQLARQGMRILPNWRRR